MAVLLVLTGLNFKCTLGKTNFLVHNPFIPQWNFAQHSQVHIQVECQVFSKSDSPSAAGPWTPLLCPILKFTATDWEASPPVALNIEIQFLEKFKTNVRNFWEISTVLPAPNVHRHQLAWEGRLLLFSQFPQLAVSDIQTDSIQYSNFVQNLFNSILNSKLLHEYSIQNII